MMGCQKSLSVNGPEETMKGLAKSSDPNRCDYCHCVQMYMGGATGYFYNSLKHSARTYIGGTGIGINPGQTSDEISALRDTARSYLMSIYATFTTSQVVGKGAGIMFRQNLTSLSVPFVALDVRENSSQGRIKYSVRLMHRYATGDPVILDASATTENPYVKLVRNGATVTGYYVDLSGQYRSFPNSVTISTSNLARLWYGAGNSAGTVMTNYYSDPHL
jgi:hypothetical protein